MKLLKTKENIVKNLIFFNNYSCLYSAEGQENQYNEGNELYQYNFNKC